MDPLPGYLCEQCQDAPAVWLQPTPEGGEMGVCTTCWEQGVAPDTQQSLQERPCGMPQEDTE